MQKIDCPICEKETDYLVSKRIHCNNCDNFFKIDELSSTQDKLNLIKIEENKYFKNYYFQMFFTVLLPPLQQIPSRLARLGAIRNFVVGHGIEDRGDGGGILSLASRSLFELVTAARRAEASA